MSSGSVEPVAVDDLGVGDTEGLHVPDASRLPGTRCHHGQARLPLQRRPGKIQRVAVGAPDQAVAARRQADLGEDLARSLVAEDDLLLPHPDPPGIHDEPAAPVEKAFLVLAFQALAGRAEEGQPAVFSQHRHQQREIAAAGVLEDPVDGLAVIGRQHDLPERRGFLQPLIRRKIGRDDPEGAFRDPPPVDEGIGDPALDERAAEPGVGAHEDHPSPQRLGDLGARETGPLPAAHQQHAVPRRHRQPLDHGPIGGAVGQQHGGHALGTLGLEFIRHRQRALLVDHGELGVEAVMGLVAAHDVPSGPGIQDDRLPDFEALHAGAGVHDDAERIAAGHVNRAGIPPAEHRDRKPQAGEIGVEIGARGQDGDEDPVGVLRVQAGYGHVFEQDGA